MRVMKTRQHGMTFWGVLFIFGFIAVVVLFTLRAFPLYNEKMQVISAMNAVTQRPDASKLTTKNIRKYFLRNIEATTNLERFTDKSVKELVKVIKPKKRGQAKVLHVKFKATSPLAADLFLLLEFDERMEIRGPNEGE